MFGILISWATFADDHLIPYPSNLHVPYLAYKVKSTSSKAAEACVELNLSCNIKFISNN